MNLLFGKEKLRQRQVGRGIGFLLLSAAIWTIYFTWRPPAPMLGLKPLTHLGDRPEISFTFDDAPHPLTTPLLLAALKRVDAPGSFFVVGDGLNLYPQLSARIVREGHRLANHSQYHNNLTRLTPGEYEHEVATCFAAIGRAGQSTKLFRPPGGGVNRDVMDYLYRSGATLAWWSNNPGDWARPPAWKLASQVEARLRPGDIVLLHDAGIGTPQALLSIARKAKENGLKIIAMPER